MHPCQRAQILVASPCADTRERVRKSLALVPVDLIEHESAKQALATSVGSAVDVIITDVRLPDASAFSLCRQLRANELSRETPVIVLSTWTSEADRLLSFESGATDFVAVPFFARELCARVEAILRRRERRDEARGRLRGSPREASPARDGLAPKEVLYAGRALALTPKERALLGALVSAGGRVLTREELIARVWAHAGARTKRSVDSHIKSIRRKLTPVAECVETVRGVGYRFRAVADLELR